LNSTTNSKTLPFQFRKQELVIPP